MHSFYSWGSWGKIKRGFDFAVSEKGHLMLPNQEMLPTWNEPGPVGILFVKRYLFISTLEAPFPVSTKKHGCKGVFKVLVSHLTFSLKDGWHPRKLFQSEVRILLQNIKSKFIFLECWSFFFFFLAVLGLCCFRLSLVAVSGSYSPLWCSSFSLWWLLLLQSTGF